jgi:hypothetical protein
MHCDCSWADEAGAHKMQTRTRTPVVFIKDLILISSSLILTVCNTLLNQNKYGFIISKRRIQYKDIPGKIKSQLFVCLPSGVGLLFMITRICSWNNCIFASNYSKMKQSLLFTDALKLKRPIVFHVMLKPADPSCNLNCTYCYYLEKNKLYPGTREPRMTEELLENFTKQLIEAHQIPTVTFTWQGGEPTLMGLDFFRKAMELQKKYSGDKKVENAFQTNGTRLNNDWYKFFADNNILDGISIDGAEHNHNHY